MSSIPIQTVKERTDTSTKENSSRSRTDRFREHLRNKMEKTEEREQKKRSIFDIVAEQNALAAQTPMFSLSAAIDIAESSSISSLSSIQCDMIIEETTTSITHMIKNGDKETSIRLDGKWCQGSPLEGVELVIKEFSTAPLAYSVTFRCSPTSLSFLQPHLVALSAALHNEKKNYAIQSIEAELEDTSPHFFHRKPALSGDQQNQKHRRDQQG